MAFLFDINDITSYDLANFFPECPRPSGDPWLDDTAPNTCLDEFINAFGPSSPLGNNSFYGLTLDGAKNSDYISNSVSADISPTLTTDILPPIATPSLKASSNSPYSPSSSSPASSTNSGSETSHPTTFSKRVKSTIKSSARIPHSAVEKNYRTSVNVALQCLQKSIPRLAAPENYLDTDGIAPDARAPTKSAVLHAAVDYIHQLERERDALREEGNALRVAVGRGEKLLEKIAFREASANVFTEKRIWEANNDNCC